MSEQLTYDPAYDVVDPKDFHRMIEVERYNRRSDTFGAIISATHEHFWDPTDRRYLDFSEPFDLMRECIMPKHRLPEFRSPLVQALPGEVQTRLANEVVRWQLSSILHGEQGALSLSAGLCSLLRDAGAQEYAANQAREEARHVTGFAMYVENRRGTAFPVGETLGDLLEELVHTEVVWKKLVGMQILLEGLAMGSFANIHAHTNDPVLKRLVQLVMTDEAFHHRFGKIWADRTMPALSQAERHSIEDWTAECFESLLFNLVNIRQKRAVYGQFGIDWQELRDSIREVYDENDRRGELKEGTNIFRILVRTLVKAGTVTKRTRGLYANWVDMAEPEAEGDEMVGDAIARDGIDYLLAINSGRRDIAARTAA